VIPLKDNIPANRFPFVTAGLIVTNIIVYLLAIRHGGSFFGGPAPYEEYKYGAIPTLLTHCLTKHEVIAGHQILCTRTGGLPTWTTIFTSMFMHASFLHIAGNMLFLWIFGNNVEDAMGPVKYLLFYLLGGIAALALQVAIHPSETAPTLGASGAIAAVLGGYILLYPRARVLTLILIILFFTVVELPAIVVLGFWFATQIAFGAAGLTSPGATGGVAYFAHIGGFLFGLATVKLLATRRRAIPPRYPVY
jgi:membrane associated rhomboid family serine protease